MRPRYEFDPFGAPVATAGEAAYDNPFRFSTKYQDDESGLLFYGYRYLSQGMGRWVSRGKRRETGTGQEVKVRHSEGVASHTGPELCVGDW